MAMLGQKNMGKVGHFGLKSVRTDFFSVSEVAFLSWSLALSFWTKCGLVMPHTAMSMVSGDEAKSNDSENWGV